MSLAHKAQFEKDAVTIQKLEKRAVSAEAKLNEQSQEYQKMVSASNKEHSEIQRLKASFDYVNAENQRLSEELAEIKPPNTLQMFAEMPAVPEKPDNLQKAEQSNKNHRDHRSKNKTTSIDGLGIEQKTEFDIDNEIEPDSSLYKDIDDDD